MCTICFFNPTKGKDKNRFFMSREKNEMNQDKRDKNRFFMSREKNEMNQDKRDDN